jgi:hypothetical protein
VQGFRKPVKGEWSGFPLSRVRKAKELQTGRASVQKLKTRVGFSKMACDDLRANKPEASRVYYSR